MQGKALIKFFTILALIVVLYQFLLWIPTRSVESNADAYAKSAVSSIPDGDDKTYKEIKQDSFRFSYLDSVSSTTVFSIPFVKDYSYKELKKQQIAWGLDLQGGMSVVMQVDLKEVIGELAGSKDPNFLKALDEAEKAQSATQSDFVTLFGEQYAALNTGTPLSRYFLLNDQLKTEGLTIESTDSEVLLLIRRVATSTVKSTHKLLKERIDKFGVSQPTVSLDESTDRITVELPGIRNPKRAREYLQATANLEFWELLQANEVIGSLVNLNELLRKKEAALKSKNNNTTVDTGAVAAIDTTAVDTTGSDLGGDLGGDLASDSTAQAENPLFKYLNPYQDANAVIGVAEGRDKDKVMAILNSAEAKRILPRAARFAWAAKPIAREILNEDSKDKKLYYLYAINTRGREKSKLTGELVTNATATPDPSGRPGYAVSLDMNEEGARIWKKMTGDNVGKQVAVVLDDEIYSAPNVNEAIGGGSTSISGSFDEFSEANDLANILSIGKLPSKPIIIEEAVIGPTLGAATVSAGLWSLAIGFVLVLLFMLGYYGTAGIIAVVCLFLNIFFILGTLASFGTVLTFAGIAGIVLTIGMAVDASVIIFERIREEMRQGAHWKDAVADGFKYSYSAILDANLTTLAVAVILYFFGLGPIKGFATVLGIGVVCSVFSAVLVGRMLFDNRVEKNKETSVWLNWSKDVLANPGIDFLSKRKMAYMISGIVLIAGIGSMIVRGFELGIDLQGGRSYTVEFAEAVNTQDLKKELTAQFATIGEDKGNEDKILVREFSKGNQVKITTSFLQNIDVAGNTDSVILSKVYDAAKAYSGGTTPRTDFENAVAGSGEKAFFLTANSKVGATIADDIRGSAGMAAGLSLLFIFFYLLVRFNKWQYSAGALAALLHDVLFVLSIFSLLRGILPFSLEINQEFIAAILTVIGYSINDTVVVFDRIREVGRDMQDRASFKEIANIALNSTVSRTVITSLTTLMVVFILFLFGGDGIRGFAFALVIGILVGTYSSIFIATPIVADTIGDSNIFDEPEVEMENAPEADDAVPPTLPA